ncbi:putative membrane transporter protein [Pseudohyphozyma bogoriensis]|nr:putative membrane transporter protein [Pseudohyphozyma bogoriensis]
MASTSAHKGPKHEIELLDEEGAITEDPTSSFLSFVLRQLERVLQIIFFKYASPTDPTVDTINMDHIFDNKMSWAKEDMAAFSKDTNGQESEPEETEKDLRSWGYDPKTLELVQSRKEPDEGSRPPTSELTGIGLGGEKKAKKDDGEAAKEDKSGGGADDKIKEVGEKLKELGLADEQNAKPRGVCPPGAFWYYDKTGSTWFPYLSGVVLGISAGYTACSTFIITAYSTEQNRGKYLALQAVITGLGSVVAASVAWGLSAQNQDSDGVPTVVYAVFVALECCALLVSGFLICHPSKVVRDDGTHIAVFDDTTKSSAWQEIKGVVACLKDWRVAILMAMQPSLSSYAFNTRSRSVLSFLYAIAQIPGVLCFWPLLDNPNMGRRRRGFYGLGALALLTYGAWLGEIGWMAGKNLDRSIAGPGYDYAENKTEFAGFAILFFLFGALYVCYSMVVAWIMAALTNSPRKLARYGGLFKGTVSGGMSVAFGIDSTLPNFYAEWGYAIALQTIGLVIMFYLVYSQVKESLYFQEDDVIVPVAVMAAEEKVHPDLVDHENQIHHVAERKESF